MALQRFQGTIEPGGDGATSHLLVSVLPEVRMGRLGDEVDGFPNLKTAADIMLTLAVEKYWRNPPSNAKDHESDLPL